MVWGGVLIDFGKSFFYIKLNKFKLTLRNVELKRKGTLDVC